MAKVFYPAMSVDVPASPPHPEGTVYRISIGSEVRPSGTDRVLRIQMACEGKVRGIKSTAFPLGTDDWKRVCHAADSLRLEYELSQI